MTDTTTVLYGASDDLIEIAGPFVDEEFSPHSDPTRVAFDRADADGGSLLAEIRLADDGIWRINVLRGGEYRIVPARGDGEPNDEFGCPGYSDRLDVHGRIGFVVGGTAYAMAKAGA